MMMVIVWNDIEYSIDTNIDNLSQSIKIVMFFWRQVSITRFSCYLKVCLKLMTL